jgi:MFS superfamily sulfate permease-like transporter
MIKKYIQILSVILILLNLFLDYRLYYIIKGQYEFQIEFDLLGNQPLLYFLGGIYSHIDRVLTLSLVIAISSLIILYKMKKLMEYRVLFVFKLYNIIQLFIIILIMFLCEYYVPHQTFG